MTQQEIQYPVYRRLLNGLTYVKIISPVEMEEIQVVGRHYLVHHLQARILPERNHIYDLTFGIGQFCEEITEAGYLETRARAIDTGADHP
ncbi:MAG: hypothetical protein FD123_2443 [Bacteroidetes bacterium]|nr:MAG: hypothetical protein FD123_2443 [Bacteroidota bacterium]